MSLVFSIAAASDVPIYRQIVHQVHRGVVLGSLKPGMQLPPIRKLAEDLVINPNTVARAYQELIHEGLAESRSGSGVFLTGHRQIFNEEQKARRMAPAVEQLVYEAILLDYSLPDTKALLENQWKEVKKKKNS